MRFTAGFDAALESSARAARYLATNPRSLEWAARLAFFSRFPIGTNIYEREWDCLIVLDACRVDALEAVADEYAFLPDDVPAVTSRATSTLEWVPQTFTRDHAAAIRETVHVTANPWTERILSGETSPEAFHGAGYAPTRWDTVAPDTFRELRTLLPDGEDEHRHVGDAKLPAETITDHAIAAGRRHDDARLLVHYLQPHLPYVAAARADGRETLRDYERRPMQYLSDGGERERVWDAYLAELRAGLDAVEKLLANLDAETVVLTADHGEAFGRVIQGHPSGSLHPVRRRVPWVTTTACDERTVDPDIDAPRSRTVSADEQLDALGYR